LNSYYVNKIAQFTGEHEVHKEDCIWLPEPDNRIHLGLFSSCHGAVIIAKNHYKNVDGCKQCSPECHRK
jgi:hypothetical protein